jgi:N12 class adenine-specific DNA methylase
VKENPEPVIAADVAAPVQAPEPAVMLDEFCRELSASDRRVALIGGFHAWATARRLLHATRATFTAAFHDYANAPVAD